MNHANGWVCTVISNRESTPLEIVSSSDMWTAPDDWILDHLDAIIDWYGGSLVRIILEPEYDGIPE